MTSYKQPLTRFGSKSTAVGVDVFSDIVILGKIEELPNLWCPLRASHPGFLCVGQSGQIILTLLYYNQVQNRKVLTDNAPTHGFPPSLSIASSITSKAWATCSNIHEGCVWLPHVTREKLVQVGKCVLAPFGGVWLSKLSMEINHMVQFHEIQFLRTSATTLPPLVFLNVRLHEKAL